MPSATRPLSTNSWAKRTDQAGGTSREALRVLDQRGGGGPIPRLQEVRGQDEQPLGRLLEGGESRPGQLQRPLVVSLLRLRAGESHPGRRVRRVQLEDPAEDGDGQLGLSLERVEPAPGSGGPRGGGAPAGWLPGAAGRLPRAGPAGGGSRPAPSTPPLASRDRRGPAGPAGRPPRSRPSWARAAALWRASCAWSPKAAAGGRTPHKSTAAARRGSRRRPIRLVTAFAFAGGDAPSQETGGPPGRADVARYGPHCDTATTCISSRPASQTGPIVPGCTAC